jgi:hypothetical protein
VALAGKLSPSDWSNPSANLGETAMMKLKLDHFTHHAESALHCHDEPPKTNHDSTTAHTSTA